MTVQIIQGDARSSGLPDRSVHCIATSPPYWGLRAYLKKDDPAKASEIGAERTPEAYVESMRAVGRECYRVLRDDGVMWINLGDTYANNPSNQQNGAVDRPSKEGSHRSQGRRSRDHGGLSPGNIVGIPWRVAFALQADGWILRAAIPWVKANGMPESVTNRPTVAHEYVFLFAKRARYFYDADAVRVGVCAASYDFDRRYEGGQYLAQTAKRNGDRNDSERSRMGVNVSAGRNLRTADFMHTALDEYEAHLKRVRAGGGLLLSPEGEPITFLVNPVANSLGHFAMWPPKLVAPMILAGTSERGCCPTCGAQWRRKVEKGKMVASGPNELATKPRSSNRSPAASPLDSRPVDGYGDLPRRERTDLGFFPTCSCPAHDPIASTVYDPFGGTGTTAQVAEALGRDSVIVELNEAYHPLIRQRLAERLNPADWKAIPQEDPRQRGFGW